jgi:hypothetical protein
MQSIKDNRVVVDLNKCTYARFGYRNQWGNWSNTKPKVPTVRGEPFDENALHFSNTLSEWGMAVITSRPMTMGEYASMNHLRDVWEPELHLKVQANSYLIYTGDKAIELNKAWCSKIFKKGR